MNRDSNGPESDRRFSHLPSKELDHHRAFLLEYKCQSDLTSEKQPCMSNMFATNKHTLSQGSRIKEPAKECGIPLWSISNPPRPWDDQSSGNMSKHMPSKFSHSVKLRKATNFYTLSSWLRQDRNIPEGVHLQEVEITLPPSWIEETNYEVLQTFLPQSVKHMLLPTSVNRP